MAKQSSAERSKLLALIPKDAERVSVKDLNGKLRLKAPQDILATDSIEVKKDGTPIYTVGKSGRKAKIPVFRPSNLPSASPSAALLQEAKAKMVEEDPIVQLVRRDPNDSKFLDFAIQNLAEELACMKFDRLEQERQGESSYNISNKRIAAITTMVDAWTKRRESVSTHQEINLDSPEFKAVLSFTIETFQEALLEASIRTEMVGVVMGKLAKRLDDGWLEEAKIRLIGGK